MRIGGCTQRYNKALKRNIVKHRLLERMVNAASSNETKEAILEQLNKLDKEGEAYMKHAEKNVGNSNRGASPSHQRRPYGFGNVRCTDHCYIGMPTRYKTAGT
jgi:hypothetical protein